MQLEWKKQTEKYSNGYDLFLGKWKVGNVIYDSCQPRESKNKYLASSTLSGLKSNLGHFTTETEAKNTVKFVTLYWIEKAGLTQKINP